MTGIAKRCVIGGVSLARPAMTPNADISTSTRYCTPGTNGNRGVKWSVVERIVWAWVFTLPATALIGYVLERLMR